NHIEHNKHLPSGTTELRRQPSGTKRNFYKASCSLPHLISNHQHPQLLTAHSLGQMSPTRKFETLSSPQPLKRLLVPMTYHSSVLGKHITPYPHGSTNCFTLASPMVITHSAGGKPKEQSSPNPTSQTTRPPRPTASSHFATAWERLLKSWSP